MSGAVGVARMPSAAWSDCRLCGCKLVVGTEKYPSGDDLTRGLCRDCISRPEAARFGPRPPGPGPTPVAAAPRPVAPAGPRAFNVAEKALIRTCIKNYMPAAQLLEILNTRLVADVGEKAVPFTMDQLWEESKGLIEPSQGGDWAGLRKVIAQARKAGLLATITPQLIDDFSTVFQLSAAQRMHLRDVIKSAQEGR